MFWLWQRLIRTGQFLVGTLSFSTTKSPSGAQSAAGGGAGEEVTATQVLDWVGSTRGAVLERGASTWGIIAPGTVKYAFVSNGAAADPSYQQIDLTAGVTGILPVANGGTGTSTGKSSYAYKATSQNLANSTVLQNDADLKWSIGASETWIYRFKIHFEAAIKTTGIKIAITVPSGATGSMDVYLMSDAIKRQ